MLSHLMTCKHPNQIFSPTLIQSSFFTQQDKLDLFLKSNIQTENCKLQVTMSDLIVQTVITLTCIHPKVVIATRWVTIHGAVQDQASFINKLILKLFSGAFSQDVAFIKLHFFPPKDVHILEGLTNMKLDKLLSNGMTVCNF